MITFGAAFLETIFFFTPPFRNVITTVWSYCSPPAHRLRSRTIIPTQIIVLSLFCRSFYCLKLFFTFMFCFIITIFMVKSLKMEIPSVTKSHFLCNDMMTSCDPRIYAQKQHLYLYIISLSIDGSKCRRPIHAYFDRPHDQRTKKIINHYFYYLSNAVYPGTNIK